MLIMTRYSHWRAALESNTWHLQTSRGMQACLMRSDRFMLNTHCVLRCVTCTVCRAQDVTVFSSVKDAVYHFCTATATKQNCKNNLILWSCVAFLGCSRWTARWLLIKSNKEKKIPRNSHITIQGFVQLAISPLSQAKSSISPRFFSSLPFYNVWWFYRPVLHALSVSLYPGALG